jgi:hypothetical protein
VQCRPIEQTLKLVEAHDERIKEWLEQNRPARKRSHEGRTHDAPRGTRVVRTGHGEQSAPPANRRSR